MVSRDILNFVFGCVEFTAENGFSERFINSCTVNNIPLWDVVKKDGLISAKTTAKGYRRIRSPARKSSMKVRIKHKQGLPFFINRYSRRTALISGFIVAFLILVLLTGHVWIIEVSGNEHLTDSEVLEAFEESGLKIGKRINNLKFAQIESSAMQKLGNASWAAISIHGCTAEIKIRELKKTPEIETHHGTSNIIASKDGQIEILEVYRGSAAVGIGQPVLEGDLLISGITESRLQTNLFTDADGYAVAKTNIKVKSETDKKITVCTPEEKKVWSIFFLGAEIFPPKDKGDCYIHRSRLKINGKELPFGINYRIYTTYEDEKEITMSKAQAELMAMTEYAIKSHSETQHTQIINQEVSMAEKDDLIEINGNYFCYENIGKSVPFDIEEAEIEETN